MRAWIVLFAVVISAVWGASRATAALPPAFADAPLRAIQFVDAHEGWAVGADGVVLHSFDGGKSWERQKTGTRATLNAVHFLTPYTGFVAGRIDRATGSSGVILHTTDGGITWTELNTSTLPGLEVVRFFDEKNGIAAGDGTRAFPAGAYLTRDGGATWVPIPGAPVGRWLCADFAKLDQGTLGSAWGEVAGITDGHIAPAPLAIPGQRPVHAIRRSGDRGVLVGAGGLVLLMTDGQSWTPAKLPLPPEALASCDFHTVAMHNQHIWIAGRPGSIVLASPDFGQTWAIQRTGVNTPLHDLFMLTESTGWAIGELGTILGTTDGGKTWVVHRTGGSRAAVLFAQANHRDVPVEVLPELGAREGYLAAVTTFTMADGASAAPERSREPAALTSAVRLAGGTAAEQVWGFPVPGHAAGLAPEALLAFWDQSHGGQARQQLLRQWVLAIRMWQPDVIVADRLAPQAPGVEQVMLYAAREAFTQAADPAVFPEQLHVLGLQPHAVKKLYAVSPEAGSASVTMDGKSFRPELAGSLEMVSAEARDVIPLAAPVPPLTFRLIAHRLQDHAQHTGLMDGCDLARGGTARRKDPLPEFHPQYLAVQQDVHRVQGLVAGKVEEYVKAPGDTPLVVHLEELLKEVPEDAAARMLVTLGQEYARSGRWTVARELFVLTAQRCSTQKPTLQAYPWLVRYHASSEALRRIELQAQPMIAPNVFTVIPATPMEEGVVPASLSEPAGGRIRFRSAEVERAWVGTGVDLQPHLYVASPAMLHDPAMQLAFHASRQRLGLLADAEQGLQLYWRVNPQRAGLWATAIATELWLANRSLADQAPRPHAYSRIAEARPNLDGKLDDACWAQAKPFALQQGTARLTQEYATSARIMHDAEFLYLAVECRHPETTPEAKASKRRRDDDLAGRDRVDFTLDLDRDYQSYFRFQIDHRGCVAEDCSGDRTWNPRWFVAVEPTPTGWTAEIAIPLPEVYGSVPRHGYVWAMNLTRVLPGKGVLSWSGPADADPRPEGAGILEFTAR